jgi:hypothetical protein
MNYIAFDLSTGKILYFYAASGPITSAPEGLSLMRVGSEISGSCTDTHKVVSGELVLIE